MIIFGIMIFWFSLIPLWCNIERHMIAPLIVITIIGVAGTLSFLSFLYEDQQSEKCTSKNYIILNKVVHESQITEILNNLYKSNIACSSKNLLPQAEVSCMRLDNLVAKNGVDKCEDSPHYLSTITQKSYMKLLVNNIDASYIESK